MSVAMVSVTLSSGVQTLGRDESEFKAHVASVLISTLAEDLNDQIHSEDDVVVVIQQDTLFVSADVMVFVALEYTYDRDRNRRVVEALLHKRIKQSMPPTSKFCLWLAIVP